MKQTVTDHERKVHKSALKYKQSNKSTQNLKIEHKNNSSFREIGSLDKQ